MVTNYYRLAIDSRRIEYEKRNCEIGSDKTSERQIRVKMEPENLCGQKIMWKREICSDIGITRTIIDDDN
jgi:hypothetical protein